MAINKSTDSVVIESEIEVEDSSNHDQFEVGESKSKYYKNVAIVFPSSLQRFENRPMPGERKRGDEWPIKPSS